MTQPDEWQPKKARTMEAWDAYWARQRRGRRFRHDHIGPFLGRWKRRLWATPLRLRQVRWFVQRGRRGWADSDAWSLDDYLCRVAGESVAHLRKTTRSHPCGIGEGDCSGRPGPEWDTLRTCNCEQAWNDILDRISGPLLAWRTRWDLPGGHDKDSRAACTEAEKKITDDAADALRLLAGHLPSLWD
jgi:hypothetical protein